VEFIFLAMAEIFIVVDSWMEASLCDTTYSPPSLATSLTAASTAFLA
jgi:hypothetical protein